VPDKRKRRQHREGRNWLSQRGVILLETLVGVAVISTTVLTGLVALSTASIATDQVAEESTGGWIAVSQIESVRTQPYVNTGGTYTSVATPAGYSVQNTTSAYPGGNADIQIVTVTVSKGGQQILQKQVTKVRR
jgi:Tfp pilus assembly protein PilV